ncbi:MAG: hypothetical protein MPJ78_06470 [Hyphomicrobiaceae bacterium]|nr:hypothetical protein [Hyphomicrobiaceae bacterium]
MLAERNRSLLTSAALVLFLLFGSTSGARTAELVMFEQPLCEWCEVWEEEVGVVYSKTSEGKKLPIRKIDIHDTRPTDLGAIKPVIYTPTFVLIHEGSEVGRILGYPGEDHFWGLLNSLMERIPADG